MSNTTSKYPRYINIPQNFEAGEAIFSLDGLLVLNFTIIRNPFIGEFAQNYFDNKQLRKADKKYRSRIVFIDTALKRSFILEINPVFSTIHMKSDYKKVRCISKIYLKSFLFLYARFLLVELNFMMSIPF